MVYILLAMGVLGIVCSGLAIGMLVRRMGQSEQEEEQYKDLYGDPDDWGA